MDLITPRLEEIKRVISKLKLFTIVLDSIIVFILSSIFFVLFGIEIILAIIPSLIYLILKSISVVRDSRDRNVTEKKITQKYPSLDERLQTAYDNRERSNLIVDKLISGVSQRMDNICCSSFVESKKISLKVFVTIFLLFTLLTINFFHIRELGLDFQKDLSKFIDTSLSTSTENDKGFLGNGGEWERGEESSKNEREKIGGESGGEIPGFSEGPIPGMGGGAGETPSSDIYGAPSSARIEGQDIEMEVHPEYGGETEIKDVNEEINADKFKLPEEIKASSTPEQEPVEYEEIIRKYFEKLSQEEGK